MVVNNLKKCFIKTSVKQTLVIIRHNFLFMILNQQF